MKRLFYIIAMLALTSSASFAENNNETPATQDQTVDSETARLLELQKLVGGETAYEIISNLYEKATPVINDMEMLSIKLNPSDDTNTCKRTNAALWLSGRTVYSSKPTIINAAILAMASYITPLNSMQGSINAGVSYNRNVLAGQYADTASIYFEDRCNEPNRNLAHYDNPNYYIPNELAKHLPDAERFKTLTVSNEYEHIQGYLDGRISGSNFNILNIYNAPARWLKTEFAVTENYILMKTILTDETVYGYYFNNVTPCRRVVYDAQGKKHSSSAWKF